MQLQRIPHMRGDGPSSPRGEFYVPVYSPHAWGWSGYFRRVQHTPIVFPTCVGMVRRPQRGPECRRGIPHMRGDGPTVKAANAMDSAYSPHAWGWSVNPENVILLSGVFPTCVGMVRSHTAMSAGGMGIPHMRGDGPGCGLAAMRSGMYSPHAWGWSGCFLSAHYWRTVFPTCVGMVRAQTPNATTTTGFPHMRGDGPDVNDWIIVKDRYSPHAWGWSASRRIASSGSNVFPTSVGMVRWACLTRPPGRGIPHMRGDGPLISLR